jgi:hypothetical protein
MKRILVIAAALALGVACTNSGLGGGDITADTSPVTGTTTGGTPTGLTCAYQGTWDLAKAFCAGIDLAEEGNFFERYTATSIVVTDSGSEDGTCDVVFNWQGPNCAETEDWEFHTDGAADQLGVRFAGISACNPDSCTFESADDACLIGDRTNANVESFELETVQDGIFRLTGVLAHGYPECVLDFLTEWRRQ